MPAPRRLAPALLLGLAACGGPAPDSDRLRVMVVGSASGPGSLAERLGNGLVRPTLVTRDNNGRIIAGLATSWRYVDDGRSLIMRLRPEQWQDGKTLVAKDVVGNFRRLATAGEPALRWTGIAGTGPDTGAGLGVRAPIARVVELQLARPSPFLLDWLSDPALALTRPGTSLAGFVRSGTAGNHSYKRLADSPAPDAAVANIVITATRDPATALSSFQAGKTDVVIGEGLSGLGEARARAPAAALRIDPLFGLYGYRFNTGRPALADANRRRVLAAAIDRQPLVARYAIAAMAPMEGLWPNAPTTAPVSAAAAMTSGVTAEPPFPQPLRLTLLLPEGVEHSQIADMVARNWARLGVTLAISVANPADFQDQLNRGEYDLALVETSLAMPDDIALFSQFRCRAGPYCNPALDSLLDRAAASTTTRAGLINEAAIMLRQDPPMIPLFRPVRWALVSRRVEGWVPNATGLHPLGRLQISGPN